MKLETKDSGNDSNRQEYIGYYDVDTDTSLYFQDGKLNFGFINERSNGVGVELTDKQTLEMYKYMKRYFEKDLIN